MLDGKAATPAVSTTRPRPGVGDDRGFYTCPATCAIGDSNVEVVDCDFRGNRAVGFKEEFPAQGGGIYVENVGSTTIAIRGCSILNNVSDDLGGGVHVDFTRPDSIGPDIEGTTVCQNLPDQISGDFVDLGGNLISELGACDLAPFDFDGNWMVDGGDMGVLFAFWGTDDLYADVDDDGAVDGADLHVILAAWGPC